MASHHTPAGRALALPLNLLAQAIPMLTRNELASLTERLIDRLDAIDPDPNSEDDDPSGQSDEDEVNTGIPEVGWHGRRDHGAGCPISDPGEPH